MNNNFFRNLIVVLFVSLNWGIYGQALYSHFDGCERIILDEKENIKGVEYIYNAWNEGVLILNDSVFIPQKYIRYDIYKDRVLVKPDASNNEIFEINDIKLTSFSLNISLRDKVERHFVRLNRLDFDNYSPKGFFEVVKNLKFSNYLVKKATKYISDPSKSKGTMTINNVQLEFKEKVQYFLKNENGKYVELKLRKKEVLNILNGHKLEMNDFVKSRSLSFKKEYDVVRLANYYYSLNEGI